MFDFQAVILPTLLGLFAGLFGPMLLEKWKGTKEEGKKLIVMEAELTKLQESLKHLEKRLEEKSEAVETELKEVEVQVSHSLGLLKGRLSADIEVNEPPKVS